MYIILSPQMAYIVPESHCEITEQIVPDFVYIKANKEEEEVVCKYFTCLNLNLAFDWYRVLGISCSLFIELFFFLVKHSVSLN